MTTENLFDLMSLFTMGGYSDDVVLYNIPEGHSFTTFFGEGTREVMRGCTNIVPGRYLVLYAKTFAELRESLSWLVANGMNVPSHVLLSLNYSSSHAAMFPVC